MARHREKYPVYSAGRSALAVGVNAENGKKIRYVEVSDRH
jgi:hypothetical protein